MIEPPLYSIIPTTSALPTIMKMRYWELWIRTSLYMQHMIRDVLGQSLTRRSSNTQITKCVVIHRQCDVYRLLCQYVPFRHFAINYLGITAPFTSAAVDNHSSSHPF
ncbi:hypothetical protein CEXT_408981 [Caerostris extrusa]|uniref:Uncharacterized protein n=1 Tax=Caerostris extrusa TaxID=172846 RepID=A0AAV4W974_CAEEX|nr:hypothetical protein CEXT_408981 [Caerostris extrusa]